MQRNISTYRQYNRCQWLSKYLGIRTSCILGEDGKISIKLFKEKNSQNLSKVYLIFLSQYITRRSRKCLQRTLFLGFKEIGQRILKFLHILLFS